MEDWLHASKLSLNVLKTQSLIVGSGPNIRKIEGQTDAQPYFSIGDQAIEVITDTKYLGLQIDSQLKWGKQELSRTRLIDPWDILSMLRNIFHLMCSSKCIEELLNPICTTGALSWAAVVIQKSALAKTPK